MSTSREYDRTDGREDEIMRGVYRALCEQGIADVTMDDIADCAEVSPSLLHYHYDTKRNLLLSYLEYAREWHETRIAAVREDHDGAIDQLSAVLDTFVDDPGDYNRAYLQLRLQAVHDEEMRRACRARRETIIGELAAIIEAGIEAGEIRPGDPDRMARNIYTFMDGARVQHIVLGDDALPRATKRDALAYLDRDGERYIPYFSIKNVGFD
ncbi:MAG: TetR/AcrR family transcriptional regulator [Halobacteriaceae archaeon]